MRALTADNRSSDSVRPVNECLQSSAGSFAADSTCWINHAVVATHYHGQFSKAGLVCTHYKVFYDLGYLIQNHKTHIKLHK